MRRAVDSHAKMDAQPPPLELTITNTQLLVGLADPDDDQTWQAYVGRYRPMLIRYAQRLGANPDDAEDMAQLTLVAFTEAFRAGKYSRDKGRLRHWLFGIARNQVRNAQRRRPPERQTPDPGDETDLIHRQSDDNDAWAKIWDEEWRDAVMRHCLECVRTEVHPTTYEAFDLFACRGMTAEQVAEQLGLTPNAVFGAKRRVLARLGELKVEMEEVW